jgi:branched-chain amino acid transport system substrate-binding protein
MLRKMLMAAVAVGCAMVAWAAPAAADTVVKIGVILPYSGGFAQAGDELDKGLRLYIKAHEKDLPPGVKLDLVIRDSTGPNPDVAKRLAQELITREHVQLLTGLVESPNAAAIAPLTAEAKVPMVIMNAAGVQIPRLSPYVVRVSFTLWQVGLPMGQWAAKSGLKKAYVAVSDFIPGHDAEGAFTKGFTDGGGQIVGNVRIPLAQLDFAPILQRIKDSGPQVVFIFVPAGKYATAVMKAWNDLGLKEAGIQLVTTQDVMLDEELPNMGDIPLGVVSAGNYSSAATRPQNKAFVAGFKAAYGDTAIPDMFSVGGWDGMAMIFDMLKAKNGTFTADEAMDFFKHWKNPESPRGPIAIDPDTRDIVQNIYLRKVERVDGKLANVEFETIPMVKDPWKELNPPK